MILSKTRWFGAWTALALVLAGCARDGGGKAAPADDDPEPVVTIDAAAQARAIEEVRKLGGQITRDPAPAFAPVISVLFFRETIADEDVHWLEALQGLRELEINDTPVSGTGLKHLAGLPRLRRLELFNLPNFTEAGLEELAKLTQLRSLMIGSLPVSDRRVRYLTGLKELRELEMSNSWTHAGARIQDDSGPFTEATLEDVAGLTKFRKLSLASQQLTDKGLTHLAGLREMRVLRLGGPITDDGLRQLAGLTRLEVLGLRGSEVTGDGLQHLVALQQLRELDLAQTPVTDDSLKGIAALKHLDHLEKLDLSDTFRLSDAGLGTLAALQQLKDLKLPGRLYAIEGPGLRALRQALPRCEFR